MGNEKKERLDMRIIISSPFLINQIKKMAADSFVSERQVCYGMIVSKVRELAKKENKE